MGRGTDSGFITPKEVDTETMGDMMARLLLLMRQGGSSTARGESNTWREENSVAEGSSPQEVVASNALFHFKARRPS